MLADGSEHSRRVEVGVVGAPWRAEALHALSRLGLDLLLGLGPSVVVVDVVVVDVLGGLLARHQDLGAGGVRAEERPVVGGRRGAARPVRGARARRVADHARRLAPRRLEDAGQVLVQDGLGVFLTLAAGREQRVMEVGAAGDVGALLPLLFLDRQRKKQSYGN